MAMTIRDRLKLAHPLFGFLWKRRDTFLRAKMITGGAAGVLTCTGIRRWDKIVAVFYHQASAALQDLTAEFIGQDTFGNQKKGNGAYVLVDDKVDNTGGTATSSGTVVVFWEAYEDRYPA